MDLQTIRTIFETCFSHSIGETEVDKWTNRVVIDEDDDELVRFMVKCRRGQRSCGVNVAISITDMLSYNNGSQDLIAYTAETMVADVRELFKTKEASHAQPV